MHRGAIGMKKIKKSEKITILALSWRDIKAPKAGGAEVHAYEMLSRADKSKFRIYHFSPSCSGLPQSEVIGGVMYLRAGNVISVIFHAWRFYAVNRKNIDFVIDQCNTHRFFTPFWVKREKRIFYIHQLTKEIWDYSAKFPLSKIGKALEEWFLWLNRHDAVITVSESTRDELIERGYDKDRIKIIHNGVSFEPWKPEKWLSKEDKPTFIYAGRYSPYKGIDAAVEAIARLKTEFPDARLWIIGNKNQEYVEEKLLTICNKYNLRWKDAEDELADGDIISWGYVSEERKLELLSRSWALLFPSIREGWGIPVTEAGCVGTPSIVYDSPGIREAVDYGRAGFLCKKNSVLGLCDEMRNVINNKTLYDDRQRRAYRYSAQFLWDRAGNDFGEFIQALQKNK